MFDHADFPTQAPRNDVAPLVSAFTARTRIATPKGEVPIEALQVGDRVLTRDNGMQVVRGLSSKEVSCQDMKVQPQLGAVQIRKGALGSGLPERDMLVSPDHRMLIVNDDALALFDEREVLIAAKYLVGRPGIAWAQPQGVTYVAVSFDHHEVILSDGAWSESLDPAEGALDGTATLPARRTLAGTEAEMLVA